MRNALTRQIIALMSVGTSIGRGMIDVSVTSVSLQFKGIGTLESGVWISGVRSRHMDWNVSVTHRSHHARRRSSVSRQFAPGVFLSNPNACAFRTAWPRALLMSQPVDIIYASFQEGTHEFNDSTFFVSNQYSWVARNTCNCTRHGFDSNSPAWRACRDA